MKKILTALAIVGFASNAFAGAKDDWNKGIDDMKDTGDAIKNSDAKVPYPVKPFVGSIVSPLGNTVYYIAEGLDIVAQDGVEGTVKALVASGQCLDKSEHPGQAAGCAIKLAGDGVVVIWNTAGYSVTNVVDYGGEMLSDFAFVWRDAFGAMEAGLNEAGLPVLAGGAYIVKFVLNAAGVITKVTMAQISESGHDLIDGSALAFESFVDVPVQLLNPNLKQAGNSLVIGIGYSGCTAIDLLLSPVYLTVKLINATDNGNRRIAKCLDGMRVTAEQIRAGNYNPDTYMMNNYEMKP